MEPLIRTARSEDRDRWVELRYRLSPDCPTDRHRLEIDQLSAGPGIVALAWLGEIAVGFAEVSIRSDHVEGTSSAPVPYLEGWYVDPAHRGRGIGRALLRFAEKWAVGRGFRELASDAEVENVASIRLHRSLGFKDVGATVHFVKRLEEPDAQSNT